MTRSSTLTRFLLGVVSFVSFSSSLLALELCKTCHGSGRLAVEYSPEVLEQEKDVLYCSVHMSSPEGLETLGLDYKPCPKGECTAPDAQSQVQREFDAEYARRKAWLDDRRERLDKLAKVGS